MTCDGTVPSTEERLQQETLCRRQWTDEYFERPVTLLRRERIVVVWLQCLLVDVVCHTDTGTLAPDRVCKSVECWYSDEACSFFYKGLRGLSVIPRESLRRPVCNSRRSDSDKFTILSSRVDCYKVGLLILP